MKTMEIGEVYRMKSSGEKVLYVESSIPQEEKGKFKRASITETCVYHTTEELNFFEVETMEEHAKRQIAEQKLTMDAQDMLEQWYEKKRLAMQAETPEAPKAPLKN